MHPRRRGASVNLADKTANWGVSYSRGRIGLGLNWNYTGEFSVPLASLGPQGATLNQSVLTLDLTTEFRFTPRLSIFFNARNLTNSLVKTERLSPSTPAYSHPLTYQDRGVKMSAGIRGTF